MRSRKHARLYTIAQNCWCKERKMYKELKLIVTSQAFKGIKKLLRQAIPLSTLMLKRNTRHIIHIKFQGHKQRPYCKLHAVLRMFLLETKADKIEFLRFSNLELKESFIFIIQQQITNEKEDRRKDIPHHLHFKSRASGILTRQRVNSV